jgi:signal transduction histidine kinase
VTTAAGSTQPLSQSGFGLVGMQERAGLLRGSFAIETSPGDGTTVNAVFPARRRSAALVA